MIFDRKQFDGYTEYQTFQTVKNLQHNLLTAKQIFEKNSKISERYILVYYEL